MSVCVYGVLNTRVDPFIIGSGPAVLLSSLICTSAVQMLVYVHTSVSTPFPKKERGVGVIVYYVMTFLTSEFNLGSSV